MNKMLLLFSHELTAEQIEDAQNNLSIEKFIELPKNLRNKWTNIPPNLDSLKEYLDPFLKWINDKSEKNDHITIQGEFGAVYYIVQFAFHNDIIPVYATTKRTFKETKKDDKIITERIFKHVRFRKYENYRE